MHGAPAEQVGTDDGASLVAMISLLVELGQDLVPLLREASELTPVTGATFSPGEFWFDRPNETFLQELSANFLIFHE